MGLILVMLVHLTGQTYVLMFAEIQFIMKLVGKMARLEILSIALKAAIILLRLQIPEDVKSLQVLQ